MIKFKTWYNVYIRRDDSNNFTSFKYLCRFEKLPEAQKFIASYNLTSGKYKAFYVRS